MSWTAGGDDADDEFYTAHQQASTCIRPSSKEHDAPLLQAGRRVDRAKKSL